LLSSSLASLANTKIIKINKNFIKNYINIIMFNLIKGIRYSFAHSHKPWSKNLEDL